jgi:hypothetical protein
MAFIVRKPGSHGQFLARKMSTVKGALHCLDLGQGSLGMKKPHDRGMSVRDLGVAG